MAFFSFAGINLVLATCARALCAYIAPAAAGSGIPEVKAFLNGIDAHSILAPSTLFVKVYCHVTVILIVNIDFITHKSLVTYDEIWTYLLSCTYLDDNV
ncbi:chloride channel C [Artemisia annua]|uniref:Chloride channel C n=1 Tax=Artemisia annua TaxID=35608 RepID=A0A2U1LNK1_ARTAN|nr:chloride channel C [Artemisia annua]